MSYVFGIDLGTTYSCIAYLDEYGKPIVLKNEMGDHTTPSVVMVESEQNVIVGKEAKRSVEIEPEKCVQFIKRKMGKEKDSVVLNGQTYTAPEISAYILKKIVQDANSELIQTNVIQPGEEIKDVVITCPAYFGMNEKQATKTAGELAGLNVMNIINEPTAAAISYGVSSTGKEETVLVYDLGGGTFDITVMNINGSNITAIGTGGDDQLGGKDWDECLIEYVVQRYEEEYGEDLSEDPEIMAILYGKAEEWKQSLSTREKINVSVDGPAGRLREELTREKFEELTENLLRRTKNLMDEVLRDTEKQGYPISKIDKVLLVGGSSKMPQVAKMIERDYHISPSLADPDEAVAKGAALYANNEKQYHDFIQEEARKTGRTVEELQTENLLTSSMDKKFESYAGNGSGLKINITNVLSRTYGVEVVYKENLSHIVNMLMINDKLPANKTRLFGTKDPGQNAVIINIFESRSTDPEMPIENREPITSVEMRFQRAVPQGTPVELKLALDSSGLLHIVAEELEYHSTLDTTFQLSNQMTEEELETASTRISSINIE